MDEAMPIGIIDDVTFDESPEELIAKLGKPHTVTDKQAVFPDRRWDRRSAIRHIAKAWKPLHVAQA